MDSSSIIIAGSNGNPDPMANHQSQTSNDLKYTAMPGNSCFAHGAIEPLPMDILDAMSVHAKMSLTHSIVTHILKHVNNMGSSTSSGGSNKNVVYPSPAIVETYSRLMVFSEIESLHTHLGNLLYYSVVVLFLSYIDRSVVFFMF